MKNPAASIRARHAHRLGWFIFVVLSVFSTENLSSQHLDIEILRSLNSNHSPILKSGSILISTTTTYVGASVPVAMGITALVTKDDQLLKNSIYIGASLAVDAVLTYSAKSIFKRPRPYISYPDLEVYMPEKSYSFPSGHTSWAFTTATSLSLKYPRWYVIAPSFLWASAVGYSRMNLGVHYPTDVLAGALLGAGSAYLMYKVDKWYWQRNANQQLIGINNWW